MKRTSFLETSLLITDLQVLCARLDRSQRGVAPRSCLSIHPVKPPPLIDAPGPGHLSTLIWDEDDPSGSDDAIKLVIPS